jgi:CBS domain-containing protein
MKPLKTALQKLREKDIGRISVEEKGKSGTLIGLITRENIIADSMLIAGNIY